MSVWYLSKERNLEIVSFNLTEKDGVSELWVTELNGKSRKLATGKKAIDLEKALLDMIWNNFPAIVNNGNGYFGSNVSTEDEEE